MKITYDWLKDHLKISAKEDKLLEKLTDIGLEVESIENLSEGLDLFKVAKIIKTEKHPNADRLKVCDVDVGNKEIKKVVCGAPNAREGLLTVYAPPGAIIPKNKTKLVVAKIRDVTSYGMLCSESELNLSDESDGITELSSSKYAKNIANKQDNDFRVICEDINKLDIESLPYVDGFLYGFPCNDFSNVGETRGLQGEYGPLYSYGVKYINHHNPKFIFAENVSGLSNANSGFAFKKILSELSKAGKYGYNLNVNLYKFEEYGIPQARHRYIIIGFRNDLKKSFKVPLPQFVDNFKNCKDAINIPKIPKDATNNELTNQSNTVIERLKYINPGENAWTANIPEDLKLNVKGAKLSMIYKRLDPKKPAYTITGSGGGGTHVYHWKENRALTNRERARLQTFPDDFEFFGSKESVRRQIGMAVPVKGVQIILESILMVLAGKEYPSIEPNVNFNEQETFDF